MNKRRAVKLMLNCLFAIGLTLSFLLCINESETISLELFIITKLIGIAIFSILCRMCIWFNRNYTINEES